MKFGVQVASLAVTGFVGSLLRLLLFVGCLTSQQHARVSQERIYSDNSTCCNIDIEVADRTFYLTQSQYSDTGPTSPTRRSMGFNDPPSVQSTRQIRSELIQSPHSHTSEPPSWPSGKASAAIESGRSGGRTPAFRNLALKSLALSGHCQDCCGLLVGCLTSQQHASVSQGRSCSDNCTCCHTEMKVADQTFYLTQSQYTDTGPTSPSADPIKPGAWQGSHCCASF